MKISTRLQNMTTKVACVNEPTYVGTDNHCFRQQNQTTLFECVNKTVAAVANSNFNQTINHDTFSRMCKLTYNSSH